MILSDIFVSPNSEIMMQNWFTCKVSYSKPNEEGEERKVVEAYLLNAYTYTEAEGRMYQIIQDDLGVSAEVSQITKSNFTEIFRDDSADLWFRVKVAMISYEEKTGKEKHSNHYYLVQAVDVKSAFDRIDAELNKGMTDYVIPSINYTKILDVFEYNSGEAERVKLINSGFKPVEPSETASEMEPKAETETETVEES